MYTQYTLQKGVQKGAKMCTFGVPTPGPPDIWTSGGIHTVSDTVTVTVTVRVSVHIV